MQNNGVDWSRFRNVDERFHFVVSVAPSNNRCVRIGSTFGTTAPNLLEASEESSQVTATNPPFGKLDCTLRIRYLRLFVTIRFQQIVLPVFGNVYSRNRLCRFIQNTQVPCGHDHFLKWEKQEAE